MTFLRKLSQVQWILALGGWTFFVWFQRIGNVLGDDELSGFARTWRLGVAVLFVVAAVVLVVGVWASRRRPLAPWVSGLGVWLALIGSAWWILRGSQILIGDWDLAFKAVHTVLAVVVVGLSVMVWRTRGYDPLRYG
jgi:hypothetical protein